jgi:predicted GNAT family N-acyltransferase
MSDLQVVRVTSDDHMRQALVVRRTVFVEEQGIDADIEVDEHDADPGTVTTAVHMLGLLDGEPVATARLLLGNGPPEEAHIGRVAVLDVHRGKGYGKLVMEALHVIGRELRYREVVLGAEATAVGFYERLGYVCEGEPYMHVGILHQDMRLKL